MPDKNRLPVDGVTRRRLMGVLGAGATGALAGCNDREPTGSGTLTSTTDVNDESTPTETTVQSDLAHVEGQTLRMPMQTNPEEVAFFDTGSFPRAYFKNVPWKLCHEHGMWGPWSNKGLNFGEPRLLQYSSFDLSSDEMTIEIRDDATWSDGEPVKARDYLTMPMAYRLFSNLKPFDEAIETGPGVPTDTITDVKISGKSWTWISEGGLFDQVIDQTLYGRVGAGLGWAPQPRPTHVEPYKGWHGRVENAFRQAVEGELHPWADEPKDPGIRDIANGDNQIRAAEDNGNPSNLKDEWFDKFRQAENVVTNGPFKPKAIRGAKEIVLEKNPEYYGADEINFDEVVLELREEKRARWAAMKGNQLDLNTDTTPQNIVDSFPDTITQRQTRANDGISLALNHNTSLAEDRKVRHGIYYALDKEQIARTVHPTAESAVKTPGGDHWGMGNWVSDEFVNDTLRSFEQDLEKAEQLLRQAGWSLEGGSWVLPSGEKAKVTVPTTNMTPQMEVVVSNQLNNFGIKASVQTMDNATFRGDKHGGNLTVWPSSRGTGWSISMARLYQNSVVLGVWAKMFGWFSEDEINQTTYGDEQGGNGLISPATEESFAAYTLEAPEVGDWGGSLKEWRPAKMGWSAYRADSQQQYKELVRKLAWLYNWHLPMFPLTDSKNQMFMDTAHWRWPDDEDLWSFVGVQEVQPLDVLGNGLVSANPDDPEEGASVQ